MSVVFHPCYCYCHVCDYTNEQFPSSAGMCKSAMCREYHLMRSAGITSLLFAAKQWKIRCFRDDHAARLLVLYHIDALEKSVAAEDDSVALQTQELKEQKELTAQLKANVNLLTEVIRAVPTCTTVRNDLYRFKSQVVYCFGGEPGSVVINTDDRGNVTLVGINYNHQPDSSMTELYRR